MADQSIYTKAGVDALLENVVIADPVTGELPPIVEERIDGRVAATSAPVDVQAAHAYPAIAKLASGLMDLKILNLSDSTGSALDGYLSQLLDHLGTQWPSHGTEYTDWNPVTKAWDATTTRTTGTTANKIQAWNAGHEGQRFIYPQAFLKQMVVDIQPDVVFINFGHNEGSNDPSAPGIRMEAIRLIEAVRSLVPEALIYLFSQNPRYDEPSYGRGANEYRSNYLRDVARLLGVGFIDMYEAFMRTGNPRDYIRPDLLHPNEAGQQLMAETLYEVFRHRPLGQPLAQPHPALLTPARNLLPNGDFAAYPSSPGAPTGFVADHCTVEKSTDFFENPAGYSLKLTGLGSGQPTLKSFPSTAPPWRLMQGQWVTLAGRFYVPPGSPANCARVNIAPVTSGGNSVVSAEGGWKWEFVSKFITSTTTFFQATAMADTSSTSTATVYLDRLTLVRGLVPRDCF